MNNTKPLILLLSILLIFSSCVPDPNLDDNSPKANIFSMSFVYSDDSETAHSLFGPVTAHEGNIYKKLILNVTNLTNEKQSLGEQFSIIKIILSNNHQYRCLSFYDSVMPGQTKRIEIYFEVIKGESINNATVTITHSFPYLYNDTYEIKLSSSTEPQRTDYQLKKDIIGTWEYIDPVTQEADGYICFRSDFRCLLVKDGGWDWTGYSIKRGQLTFESNILNQVDYTLPMLLDISENELLAFSDSTKIQAGSGKLHTYQKMSNFEMDSFPYSSGYQQAKFLRGRYWFTENKNIGFYFESDGTGKLLLKSKTDDTYSQGNITWKTDAQKISITSAGSAMPLIDGVYAFASPSDSLSLYLYLNNFPTLICEL